MKSTANESDSDYELGVAYEGLCHDEECSWKVADDVVKWVCCCNQHLCNTGFPVPTNTTTESTAVTTEPTSVTTEPISTSNATVSTTTAASGSSIWKSTIVMLTSALMMLIVARKDI